MSDGRRFRVDGRVQGVFFRASTRRMAQSLGLTGWVHNCSDGSVEGLVCGPPAALERFCNWLWSGPDAAHVERVELTASAEQPPATFEFI